MRAGELVFVDTGAWIALALTRDPLHSRAREMWEQLLGTGVKFYTSVPVVLETFTFLDRNGTRDVALAWKDSLEAVPRFKILSASAKELEKAWSYFERKDLHRLSAVDALSFVLMRELHIRAAFAFDSHFAAVGFRMLG